MVAATFVLFASISHAQVTPGNIVKTHLVHADLQDISGLTLLPGSVLIGTTNSTVYGISGAGPTSQVLVGSNSGNFLNDGDAATSGRLMAPVSVVFSDVFGICEKDAHRIRATDYVPGSTISTIMGTGLKGTVAPATGDKATSTSLDYPSFYVYDLQAGVVQFTDFMLGGKKNRLCF